MIIKSLQEYLDIISDIDANGKIIVYTAIINNYDKLKEVEIVDKNIRYYCFTNNKDLSSENWRFIYIDTLYRDPRRTARLFKILPHLFFKNCKKILWVDGSCAINGSVVEFINKYCKNGSMFLHSHQQRDCIYKEAKYIKLFGKESNNIINKQINYYKKSGFPSNYGLVDTTVIIRNLSDNEIIKFNNRWWEVLDEYSNRDQLSFNFISWKYRINYTELNYNITFSDYFIFSPHLEMKFYSMDGKRINYFKSILTNLYLKLRLKMKSLNVY